MSRTMKFAMCAVTILASAAQLTACGIDSSEQLDDVAASPSIQALNLSLAGGMTNTASLSNGNYGSLPHEGMYPMGNHACGGGDGWSQPIPAQSGTYNGRTYTIRLCYSDSYGAYARLDGAAINDAHCAAILDRSNTPNETSQFSNVFETVDGGVGYAYTKVGNNLDGRLARAAVLCGSTRPGPGVASLVIARTPWY